MPNGRLGLENSSKLRRLDESLLDASGEESARRAGRVETGGREYQCATEPVASERDGISRQLPMPAAVDPDGEAGYPGFGGAGRDQGMDLIAFPTGQALVLGRRERSEGRARA
jgi:hypothetical protein